MDSKRAILIPLLYSSIFQFPLTKKELWYFLPKKLSFSSLLKTLSTYPSLFQKDDYVTLKGKKEWIEKRIESEKKVTKKREEIKSLLAPIAFLPWILFIGISGSLGAGQYQKKGDVDLFLITKSHSLWISRLIILLFLKYKRVLRTKTSSDTTELVCVNMFLDESSLHFPKKQQDLYTAREIHQLYPLIDKQHTYKRFLQENFWTFTFFPNAQEGFLSSSVSPTAVSFLTRLFNLFAFQLQLLSIRKTQTVESVSLHLAAFHPRDYRMRILGEFEAKMSTIPH